MTPPLAPALALPRWFCYADHISLGDGVNPALSLRQISKSFQPGVPVLRDISLQVETGTVVCLLGPSGCGKTTTLRSIAGLERPRAGEISVNGRVVFSSARRVFVAPNRRGFGMVFQSYAIWPHMTVFENAAFPLQVRGAGLLTGRPGPFGPGGSRTRLSRSDIRDRVMRVLHAVQLGELAEREATKLSGGQQQRLALARALVMEPALLLLDEPLSNLDAKLRERMRFELKRLQRELKITTVYVTHDQSEALALSRQIAVMSEGRILQIGTPRDIYERPASQFVADFVGNTNFIDGVVRVVNPSNGVCIRTEIGELQVQTDQELRVDEHVAISVRPEDVELTEARPPGGNVWEGRVDQKVFLGEAVDFQVKVGPRTLLSRRHPTLRTKVGDTIFVQLNPEKCVVLKVA
jgi:iron(III) transport system ATP-binding protein